MLIFKKLQEKIDILISSNSGIKELNEFIKNNFECHSFGIFESFGFGKVLCYITKRENFIINKNGYYIIFVSNKNYFSKKEFDKIEYTIQNINLLIGKEHNNTILKFFNQIQYQDYLNIPTIGRIVGYFSCELLRKEHNNNFSKKNKFNKEIIIGDQKTGKIKNISEKFGIHDYHFNNQYFWFPKFEINEEINKLIEEVEIARAYNKKYFNKKKDGRELFDLYIIHKDAESSAGIEGYYKNSSEGKQVIENLYYLYKIFDSNKEFNIGFLQDIQAIIVNKIWGTLKNKQIPGSLREGNVCVVQEISIGSYNIVYPAPIGDDIYIMLNDLCILLEKLCKEYKLHPIIIATLISIIFVNIHPFYDGNGRTSRFLFLYVLKKLKYINGFSELPISRIIEMNRKEYSKMFEDQFHDIKYKIHSEYNEETRGFDIEYTSPNVYKEMNYNFAIIYFLKLIKLTYYYSIIDHNFFVRKQEIIKIIENKIGKLKGKKMILINKILENKIKFNDLNISKTTIKNLSKEFNDNDINTIIGIFENLYLETKQIELEGLTNEELKKIKYVKNK